MTAPDPSPPTVLTETERVARAFVHEPCGRVVTGEWRRESNGGCPECEWVTREGWTPLFDDYLLADRVAAAVQEERAAIVAELEERVCDPECADATAGGICPYEDAANLARDRGAS